MQQSTNAQIRPDLALAPIRVPADVAGDSWLSLGGAAAALGVHPITLRRWADSGRIPSSRTVGDHRRFRRTDIEAFLRERRRIRRLGAIETRWAAEAHRSLRRRSPFDIGAPFPLDSRDRFRFRRSGRRLLSLLAAVSHGSVDAALAQRQARRLGRAYASWATKNGIGSAEMLRAFGLVRRTLIDAALDVVESEDLEPEAVRGLLADLEEPMQAVELGLLEADWPRGLASPGEG